MKVAVQCESPLLQRSLETFLASHLSTLKQCDVVVRDRRTEDERVPSLVISNSEEGMLSKPFTRSQLMLALEQMVEKRERVKEAVALSNELEMPLHTVEAPEFTEPEKAAHPDFSMLEKRIEQITRAYQEEIIKTVRAFYES